MSKLDTKKLRKVRALMNEGATKGERAAAQGRAEQIAANAGMSLEAAMSILDADAPQEPAIFVTKPSNFFEELFNTPEFRARQAERGARDAATRAEAVERHGSEEKVFAETERERLLSNAVDHLKEWDTWDDGQRYVSGLAGAEHTDYWADRLPEQIVAAVRDAYPMPSTLSEAFAEYQGWDAIYLERVAFGSYDHWFWVQARISLIEGMLDSQPVASWEDAFVRVSPWWETQMERSANGWPDWAKKFRERIAADVEILRGLGLGNFGTGPLPETGEQLNQVVTGDDVQVRRRTNAEKQADVLSILDAQPGLTDRQIADLAGVSPQTANTWRKKRAKWKRADRLTGQEERA